MLFKKINIVGVLKQNKNDVHKGPVYLLKPKERERAPYIDLNEHG